MKNTAIVAYSVNSEIIPIYDRNTNREKGDLKSITPSLAGTSANVARAIITLGGEAKILVLTGTGDDFETNTLELLLEKSTIPYSKFSILDKSNISIFPIDGLANQKTFSKKGNIEISKIQETVSKIQEEKGQWRIATGVRTAEILLVKALHGRHNGFRVLNPRLDLILDKLNFSELLKSSDLLVMNQQEYEGCKVVSPADLHNLGPELIIITQGKNGGMFSKKGCKPETFNSCIKYSNKNDKTYSPGAGDWFLGAFIVRCMELEKSINTLTIEEIRDCIDFATRVAGKKVTMMGAANGPSKSDL